MNRITQCAASMLGFVVGCGWPAKIVRPWPGLPRAATALAIAAQSAILNVFDRTSPAPVASVMPSTERLRLA
jgi:hypothetical protein